MLERKLNKRVETKNHKNKDREARDNYKPRASKLVKLEVSKKENKNPDKVIPEKTLDKRRGRYPSAQPREN